MEYCTHECSYCISKAIKTNFIEINAEQNFGKLWIVAKFYRFVFTK